MKKLIFIICIPLMFFALPAHSQVVQFFREKIDIEVRDSAAVVTGTYYFKNISGREVNVPLYYPFVVNDSLPPPDRVAVTDMVQKKAVPFFAANKGVRFFIRLPAKSIRIYRVAYRQSTPYRMMEYILTTTRAWGRTLQSAEYMVILPQTLTLTDSSLPFRQKSLDTPFDFYYYNITNFLPHKNFHIRWRSIK